MISEVLFQPKWFHDPIQNEWLSNIYNQNISVTITLCRATNIYLTGEDIRSVRLLHTTQSNAKNPMKL